jgi:hypothetical protein
VALFEIHGSKRYSRLKKLPAQFLSDSPVKHDEATFIVKENVLAKWPDHKHGRHYQRNICTSVGMEGESNFLAIYVNIH